MLKRTHKAGLFQNHLNIRWVEARAIMSALAQFRSDLAVTPASRGLTVAIWGSGGRRSANLLVVSTKPKESVLYVKEFNVPSRRGFWGLTHNQVERLEAAARRWFAVLLLRSSSSGYVLTGSQVLHRVQSGAFELSGDGDFKVNEETDLVPSQHFASLDDLIARIL